MATVCPDSYAHALDGLYRVAREEGLKKLFSGATMASSRGMLVTVGQVRLLLGGGGIRGVWPQPSERSRRKAVGTECGRGGASSVPRPQVW